MVRTVFVKPENAINVPEKYRTKSTESPKKSDGIEDIEDKGVTTDEDVTNVKKAKKTEKVYDVDPRHGQREDDIDLSEVNIDLVEIC